MNQIKEEIEKKGYSFNNVFDSLINQSEDSEKSKLIQSWNELEKDLYLKDKWVFRQRRYSRFKYTPNTNELTQLNNSSYFQHQDYNSFNGGELREMHPLKQEVATSKSLSEIIKFDFSQFPINESKLQEPWIVGIHQFRIVSENNKLGEPTPEGIHQDGHEYFAIHLVNRENIDGGVTSLYDLDKNEICTHTLTQDQDTLFVEDRKVMHGVSPIKSLDKNQKAYRDVLVVEFDNINDLFKSEKYPNHILDQILR